ncbi:MAG TPA: TMEM175 family protein [Dehalococcoidia bacterium]|nr:TMEM175 family protein [Dehalococcoidia bacterium]
MSSGGSASEGERETGRLEAFSDGVFAVAITLLVLDLKVPPAGEGARRLGPALLDQWPAYLGYAGSFLSILIMWVNHHQMFRRIARVDHGLLFFNGLLLMAVTVVPFTTSLLSEYIGHREERLAAVLYCGTFVLISLFWNLVWRYAAWRHRLLHSDLDEAAVARLSRRNAVGPPVYAAAVAVAVVNAVASVVFMIAIAVYWSLPGLSWSGLRRVAGDASDSDLAGPD